MLLLLLISALAWDYSTYLHSVRQVETDRDHLIIVIVTSTNPQCHRCHYTLEVFKQLSE